MLCLQHLSRYGKEVNYLLYEFLARELKIQARFPSIQPQEHLEYSNSPSTALVKGLLLQKSHLHSASMYSPSTALVKNLLLQKSHFHSVERHQS